MRVLDTTWQRKTAASCATLLFASLTISVHSAAEYQRFPGAAPAVITVQVQERVEGLYAAEDYSRALIIYQKQLAPTGDKYAQYMVGYMYLTGRGVAVEPAMALAWYRLAAEREERPFVRARDTLQATLDAATLQRAEELYARLLPEFGDRQLLLRLINEDVRFLRSSGAGTGLALAAGFLGGPTVDHEALARDRLQERLAYLDKLPEVPSLAEQERQLREDVIALLAN